MEILREEGNIDEQLRRKLACKVFEHTAHYDALIADYLDKHTTNKDSAEFPENLTLTYENTKLALWGNPIKSCLLWRNRQASGTLAGAKQLNGKELSFNNINDADATLKAVLSLTCLQQ